MVNAMSPWAALELVDMTMILLGVADAFTGASPKPVGEVIVLSG
jgi:hypothetical protein